MKIYSGQVSKEIRLKENQQTNLGTECLIWLWTKLLLQVKISILPLILDMANTGLWTARFLKKGNGTTVLFQATFQPGVGG